MEKEQKFNSARAMNKIAIACHLVIGLVLEVAYLLEVVKGSRTMAYYLVFSLVTLIPIVVELLLYLKNPEDLRLKYVIGLTYSVFYTFVVFTTVNMIAFTYIIPICIVLMLYSDVMLCSWVSGVGFAVNVVFLAWQGMEGNIKSEDMATYEIRVAVLLLVAIFLFLSTRTLERINQSKIQELDQEKDNVSTLLDQVMRVSGQMSGGILDVAQQMRDLGSAVEETRDAMQEVSAGTNETAESVQNHLVKTEEIQNHIGQMGDVMNTISQSMAGAKSSVRNGRQNLDALKAQMENSERVGRTVVEDMKELET